MKKKILINKFYIGEKVYYISPFGRFIERSKITKIVRQDDNYLLYKFENSAVQEEKYIAITKEGIKKIFLQEIKEETINSRQDIIIKED